MRTDRRNLVLALLLRASFCSPPQRTDRDAVHAQAATRLPAGSGAVGARAASEWRERASSARVLRLEAGCGRSANRLATLEDGSRACVRYGVDQDQVLGETLCYHLSTLLGINHVPPLALTKPDPSSWQWSAVRDTIEALHWSPHAIVSLTQWVPSATPVSIPVQMRRHMETGVPWTLQNVTSSDLRELLQWTDLILFDYLTANFDRVASQLLSLQWDKRALTRPTNNLLRTPEGHLVFIDNEAGLVHGYRVLDRWENLHQMLLNSTCVFRDSTVQHLSELKQTRSVVQHLRQVYQAREAFSLELGFLSKAQMAVLQSRVDTLYRHLQQCADAT